MQIRMYEEDLMAKTTPYYLLHKAGLSDFLIWVGS
jgi:hypothetical protein